MSGDAADADRILCQAVEIESPDHRERFLAEACAGNEELRCEVDRLLTHHQQAGAFLERPALVDVMDLTALEEGVLPQPPVPVNGVLGDYRIHREIGRGGMGVVYEAEQISLERKVALKVLPMVALLDARQLQRFHNEARAAAQLDHPNIVDIYGVGCERGVHYYAMQYVEGTTLAVIIDELRQGSSRPQPDPRPVDPASPPGEAGAAATVQLADTSTLHPSHFPEGFRSIARIGMQAAAALDHAHAGGILHRDIKPGNLMLDVRGNLWITDFGLARVGDEAGLTLTGDFLGTPRYMSPEQVLGKRAVIDHRSDIYSLGATLYELLTLTPAVPGRDRQKVLNHIATEDPVPPRRIDPDIPVDLSTIVFKALAREPEERYDTAADLAADLRRFLSHEPIRARPPSLSQRLSKWTYRHRSFVAALTAVLLCTTLALGVATVLISRARNEAVGLSQDLGIALGEKQRILDERNAALADKQAALDQKNLALQREAATLRDVYPLNIAAAGKLINDGNYELARNLVSLYADGTQAAGRRGFAWHYLQRLVNGHARRLHGHAGTVFGVSFSPDSRRLVTASGDGTFCLWDAESGERLWQNTEHTSDVNSAVFSPDGQTIATASDDHTIGLWDAETGQRQATLHGHADMVQCVEFTPDSQWLVSGAVNGEVRVWDRASGRSLASIAAHAGRVRSLDISEDGTSVATGGDDATARTWKLPELESLLVFPHPQEVETVAFHPVSGQLVTGMRNGRVTFLDSGTGELISHLDSGEQILGFTFAPEGERWAASGGGLGRGVRVWSERGDHALYSLEAPSWCVAFSPDGRYLAAGAHHDALLWDLHHPPAWQVLRRTTHSVMAIAAVPDSSQILVGDEAGSVQVLDLLSSREVDSLHSHPGGMNCLRFSPDGRVLAVGGDDRLLRIYDGKTLQQLVARPWDYGPVRALEFSPDGNVLAVTDGAQFVTYSTADWEVIDSRDDDRLHSFRLTARGGTISAGSQLVWYPPNEQSFAIRPGHRDPRCEALAVTREGTLAAAGFSDGSVVFFDVPDPDADRDQQIHSLLDQQTVGVLAAAFSRDGTTLATGDRAGKVLLWDVATRTLMLQLDLKNYTALPNEAELERLALEFMWDGSALIAGGNWQPLADVPDPMGFVVAWYGQWRGE